MSPAAMAYVQLGAAILVEVGATACLKHSEGMSRLLPTLASLLGYGISFYLLSKVLNVVPMGISYGIWSGIGIVLVSLLGLLVFGQKLDLRRLPWPRADCAWRACHTIFFRLHAPLKRTY
jgi:Membrane transporters of cations and cationic drugs